MFDVCIAVVCFPVCYVINFEIYLSIKKSVQKLKYFKSKKSESRNKHFSSFLEGFPANTPRVFHGETKWKRLFQCHFSVEYTWYLCRVSVPRNCLRTESAILSYMMNQSWFLFVSFKGTLMQT